jgi:hypothetical protein
MSPNRPEPEPRATKADVINVYCRPRSPDTTSNLYTTVPVLGWTATKTTLQRIYGVRVVIRQVADTSRGRLTFFNIDDHAESNQDSTYIHLGCVMVVLET